MRFGVCASYQDVGGLRDISFDFLEEAVQRFLVPEQPREVFEDNLRQARALPVPVETANALLPADLIVVATPSRQVDTARLERYIRTVLQRAEQAGIRVISFGSGAARACPDEWDRAAAVRQIGEHVARWNEWGRDHGVQIALEPLRYAETNIINTVAEAGALARDHEASGVAVLADLYHMACNGELPASLEPWVPYITHVHVAERDERSAPGRQGDDFRPFFAVLRQGGYDRRIAIECRWHNFAAEVGPAIAALREQWVTSV